MEGQSGDVDCVAPYPVEMFGHIYATASADGNVYLWDADRRENLRAMECRCRRRPLAPLSFTPTHSHGRKFKLSKPTVYLQ